MANALLCALTLLLSPVQDKGQDPVAETLTQSFAGFPDGTKADRLQWVGKLAQLAEAHKEDRRIIDTLIWFMEIIDAELDKHLPEPEKLPEVLPTDNPAGLRWLVIWRGFETREMINRGAVLDGEDVRRATLNALKEFKTEVSQKHLKALFQTGERVAAREAAVQALVKCELDDFTRDLLLALKKEKSWRVRAAIIEVLMERDDRDAGYILRGTILDDRWEVRFITMQAIPKIGHPNILTVALTDPQWELRMEAIRLIEMLEYREAVPSLLEMVKDDAWTVREAALRVLGSLGNRTIIRWVVPALEDEVPNVRMAGVSAIERATGKKGLRTLVDALDNDNPDVVKASIEAIRRINNKLALGYLINRANERKHKYFDPDMQMLMEDLTAQQRKSVSTWDRWWDLEFRRAAGEFDTYFFRAKVERRLELIEALRPHDKQLTCERMFKVLSIVEKDLEKLLPEQYKMLRDQQNLPTHSRRAIGHWNNYFAKEQQLYAKLQELYKQWRAALDTLSDFGSTESIQWMTKRVEKSKFVWEREGLAEALGGADAKHVGSALTSRADKDSAWTVRVHAIDSLVACYVPESFAVLLRKLEDPVWHVQLATIIAMERLGGKKAVEPFIKHLEKKEGRLHGELLDALTRLTGITKYTKPESWLKWWEAKGAEFMGQKRRRPVGTGLAIEDEPRKPTFYGFTVNSKRVLFVVDVSGSMVEPAEWKPDPKKIQELKDSSDTKKKMNKKIENDKPAGDRKIDVAKYELRTAIRLLDGDTLFNVVLFSYGVQIWQPTLVQASNVNKEKAINWVQSIPAWGGTNTYDAIEISFSVKGPPGDKWKNQGADTFFIVSDGRPSVGRIKDTAEILKESKKLNRTRRVRINTIAVGKADLQNTPEGHGVDAEFLRKLAVENYGQHVWRK